MLTVEMLFRPTMFIHLKVTEQACQILRLELKVSDG